MASGAEARATWLRAALLFGLGYFLVGRLFAVPGEHAQTWRFAAWLVSLLLFTAHLRYERARPSSVPRIAALHVATAVAIGAFALAVALTIRSIAAQGSLRMQWVLALVLFPLVTAVPAFLVALVVALVGARRGHAP